MSMYIEPRAYDLASFCKAYSISRSYAYLEIKAGRLKPFKAGRKTLISREAAEAWRRCLEGPSGNSEETSDHDRLLTEIGPITRQRRSSIRSKLR